MTADKVQTLLGFAIKAGKTVFGADSIERYRKKKYLLLMCGTLSENARNKLLACCRGIPAAVVTGKTLAFLTHREGLKAMLVTDKQMSQAIVSNMDENYRIVTEVDLT